MQSAEDVLGFISPELLALQSSWWISFLFGPTPQRPHESYDIVLDIKGEPFSSNSFLSTYAYSEQCIKGQRPFDAEAYFSESLLKSLVYAEESCQNGAAEASDVQHHLRLAKRIIRSLVMQSSAVPEGRASKGERTKKLSSFSKAYTHIV